MRSGVYHPMATSFDKYPYSYITKQRDKDGYDVLLYTFRSSKCSERYIVRVELHPHHFYGIKFYLKKHTNSEKKYNILTGLNEPRFVLNTIFHIVFDILEEQPDASFCFIGATTFAEENREEPEDNTKRFRFYMRLISSYLPLDDMFYQWKDVQKSTCILINKKIGDDIATISNQVAEYLSQFDF